MSNEKNSFTNKVWDTRERLEGNGILTTSEVKGDTLSISINFVSRTWFVNLIYDADRKETTGIVQLGKPLREKYTYTLLSIPKKGFSA